MKTTPHLPFQYKKDVLLSKYTTYKIGGPAKRFYEASSIEDLAKVIKVLSEAQEEYIILGKGSNLLFDDRGYHGTVILNKISFIEWEERAVRVGAGYSFALLGVQSARKGFSGLEFASGIPGTVGGAVFMNAGANQMEVKDALVSVDYIDQTGKLITLQRDECEYAYRWSLFHENKGAIVSAIFALTPSTTAKERQREILDYRMSSQPYKEKTCGCAFRNPPGDSAGRIIEACGLKDFSIGGATVSSLHANFLMNSKDATADDIKALATYIKSEVERKTGIILQEEVRFIPYKKDRVNNESTIAKSVMKGEQA